MFALVFSFICQGFKKTRGNKSDVFHDNSPTFIFINLSLWHIYRIDFDYSNVSITCENYRRKKFEKTRFIQ